MTRTVLVVAIVLVVVAALLLLDPTGVRARSGRDAVNTERTENDTPSPRGDSERESERSAEESAAAAQPKAKSKTAVAKIIVGRVVDVDGVPIRGARVSITEYLDPFAPQAVLTDKNGRFSVRCHPKVPPKTRFIVRHPQFTPLANVERDTGPSLEFVLQRGLQIHGRVRFPDGRPAPRMAVEASSGAVRTDDQGAFILGGFEPGPVLVQCEGVADIRAIDAGTSNVEFVLNVSLVRITVVDSDGEPMARVRCSAQVGPYAYGGNTGKSGIYTLPTWPGMSGWVVVSRNGFLSVPFRVAPQGDGPQLHEFRAVLLPAPDTALSIRVSTPHAPASRPRWAHVYWLDDDGEVILRAERLDLEDREAVLTGLPVGPVRLKVWVVGSDAGTVKTVTIHRGKENRAEFSMPQSATVEVRLEKGSPFRIMVLETLDGRRLDSMFTSVNRDGVWNYSTPVALGRYRLLELNGTDVKRKKDIEITEPGHFVVDWVE